MHRKPTTSAPKVNGGTKAQQILDLIDRLGDSRGVPQKIAAMLGTTDSYVRTVARQRMGNGRSEAERRWEQSPLGKATISRCKKAYRKRGGERVREAHRKQSRKHYWKQVALNPEMVRQKRRERYEASREHYLLYAKAYQQGYRARRREAAQ